VNDAATAASTFGEVPEVVPEGVRGADQRTHGDPIKTGACIRDSTRSCRRNSWRSSRSRRRPTSRTSGSRRSDGHRNHIVIKVNGAVTVDFVTSRRRR